MNRMMRALCASLLAIVSVPGVSEAVVNGEPRKHDKFYFRFSLGAGNAGTAIETGNSPRFELSGSSIDLDLAAGAMVRENLALHVTVLGWNVSDPTAEQPPFPSRTVDGNSILTAYGVGATYYVMPVNVFVTGSVGAGQVKFDFPSVSVGDQTDWGVAFTAGLGKEWWVGETFGLGVSGHFTYQSAPDSQLPENWSGTAIGARLVLTYN